MNNIVSIIGHISREHPHIESTWYTNKEIFVEYRDKKVYKTDIKEFSIALKEIERKRKLDENT